MHLSSIIVPATWSLVPAHRRHSANTELCDQSGFKTQKTGHMVLIFLKVSRCLTDCYSFLHKCCTIPSIKWNYQGLEIIVKPLLIQDSKPSSRTLSNIKKKKSSSDQKFFIQEHLEGIDKSVQQTFTLNQVLSLQALYIFV